MVDFKLSLVLLHRVVFFLLCLSIINSWKQILTIHDLEDDDVQYEYVQNFKNTYTEIQMERREKFARHFLNKDPNITVVPDYFKKNNFTNSTAVPDYFRKNIFITNENATADSKGTSICTQLSISHTTMARILDIAENWKGKVSVAVFYKAWIDTERLELFTKFYNDNVDVFQDRFAFHLVMDTMIDRKRDYPINMMRNVAIEYSVTKYILVLDVDFIPSQTTFADINTHVDSLMKKDKVSMNVLVIPAFEKQLPIEESWILPDSKRELIEIKAEYHVKPFHVSGFPEGHGPTDFLRWYTCNASYSIPYQFKFEPYLVVQKSSMFPPFWEHFFGFGKNKLAWVEELALIGYEFHVLPQSFLIHINHAKHAGRRIIKRQTKIEYNRRFKKYTQKRYNKSSDEFPSPSKSWWKQPIVRTVGSIVIVIYILYKIPRPKKSCRNIIQYAYKE